MTNTVSFQENDGSGSVSGDECTSNLANEVFGSCLKKKKCLLLTDYYLQYMLSTYPLGFCKIKYKK